MTLSIFSCACWPLLVGLFFSLLLSCKEFSMRNPAPDRNRVWSFRPDRWQLCDFTWQPPLGSAAFPTPDSVRSQWAAASEGLGVGCRQCSDPCPWAAIPTPVPACRAQEASLGGLLWGLCLKHLYGDLFLEA